jgi:agmatine deiminase
MTRNTLVPQTGVGHRARAGVRISHVAADGDQATPRADGFAMPPEWAEHQLTLMSWPCAPASYRRGGPGAFERAEIEHAGVANAVAAFEPVLMLVRPEQRATARRRLAAAIDLLEVDLDDAWIRDNGPVFVTDRQGRVAMVQFRFNGWGGRYPSERDGLVPHRLAAYFGARLYRAPMVLEGGSFFVDGEGTLLTTEQCLLHPNRNPLLSREDIEAVLASYLNVDTVVWLGEGHYLDLEADGHVDTVAHFTRPGRVIVHAPSNPDHPDHLRGRENVRRLRASCDARGRGVEVVELDTGTSRSLASLNCYVCNGAVIVPTAGMPEDAVALDLLRAEYPSREVVPVPSAAIFAGGGGPHCITMQVPNGTLVPSGTLHSRSIEEAAR